MIVPSMTYDEMRNEFMHDYRIADAKGLHTYKQLQFEMHKRHQTHATETVTWKSALNNTWMTFYKMNGTEISIMNVCVTMGHRNLLKVLSFMGLGDLKDASVGEFNIHFYKRYNERMKLNLPKPILIVKHYFKHNFDTPGITELSATDDPGSLRIFSPVYGGVILGYNYPDKQWIELKTFISDEMLRESQMERAEFLKNYKLSV